MSWRKVKLGELVDNFSVRAKDVGGAEGLEFFGVSNEDGIIKTKYAAEEKAEDYKIIEKDCFAYNPYRVNVGSIGLVKEDIKGLISPAYVVFKPKPKSIKAELLLKFLKSSEGLRQIIFYARGTVRQALRFEDLCNIELSLPDYDEQEKIFKKLNFVKIESDVLSTELIHQLTLVKKLRQQLLQDAVQGKLVKQNQKDEPANELLEKIKAEKEKLIKDKKLKKEKELPPIKAEEIPFEIPENWIWCRLGDLGSFRRGPFGSALTVGIFVKEGYKVYEQRNAIYDNHTLGNYFVTKEKFQELKAFSVFPKDLIVSCSGATLGRIAEIPEGAREGIINQALMRITLFNAAIINSFFIKIFRSPYFQKNILGQAWGTAIPNMVGLVEIKKILIPLPPLSEQHRIVQKIEQLMQTCNELEESIKQSAEQNEKLLQQVLREALKPKEENEQPLSIAAEPKETYKKESIIKIPALQEKEEKHFVKRKVLATYIINQSLDDSKFGDVKFEKLLHLSDYIAIKRNLGQNYYQKAAGPYDNGFTIQYFNQVLKDKWFNRSKIGNKFVFSVGQNHSKSKNTYNFFSEDELKRVNELINYFKKYDYEQPEIISTLYAVWNNRIIIQQKITDDNLINDFYSWDEKKNKYDKNRLEKAIQWMRDKNLIPDGWGKLIEKPKKK
ncbi:MAG: restriction endonuclease subunit S [Bacteroidales bacterium]|jgi:type I restriction enzyme S subunit